MYTRPAASPAITDCKLLVNSSYVDGIIAKPVESHKKDETSSLSGHVKKFVCGGSAGVVSRTVTAPLDRLKVLLQVQGQQRVLGSEKKLNVWQMVRAMKNEGLLTMWKGNGVNCMKIFPENAIRLALFEALNESRWLTNNQYWSTEGVSAMLINGGATGVLVQTVMYPFEIIKTRIMTSSSERKLGFSEAGKQILSEKADLPRLWRWTNFYNGFKPAVLGVIPFAALELGCSKGSTDWYKTRYGTSPGYWTLLSFGGGSTFLAMLATYPFRLVTCQMQAYTGPPEGRLGLIPHGRKILRNEGVRGLYRGFGANCLKAVPSSAVAWTTFNYAQKYWDRTRDKIHSFYS